MFVEIKRFAYWVIFALTVQNFCYKGFIIRYKSLI